jgi:hypothetical protein
MKLQVPLRVEAALQERLSALQARFAQACNVVLKIAVQHQCAGRVPLHHLAYKTVRARFPELGAQLASNAVYAVSQRLRETKLKGATRVAAFASDSPVYLDRNTLGIRNSVLSLFTLEGRIRFKLPLQKRLEVLFRTVPVKEVVLLRKNDIHWLVFQFKAADAPPLAKVSEEVEA